MYFKLKFNEWCLKFSLSFFSFLLILITIIYKLKIKINVRNLIANETSFILYLF